MLAMNVGVSYKSTNKTSRENAIIDAKTWVNFTGLSTKGGHVDRESAL